LHTRYAGSWTPRAWAHANLTRLHTYQSEYWGSWVFDIAAVGSSAAGGGGEGGDGEGKGSSDTHIEFSRGGFQEARGGGIGGKGGRGIAQDFFVEGAFEELDGAREFYHNASTGMLYWAVPAAAVPTAAGGDDAGAAAAAAPNATGLVAPHLAVLLRVGGSGDAVRGATDAGLASHMRFEGLEFRHAAPTFMAPYEPTSGGDWAVHRGGAVVVEWASGVTFDGCVFASLEGNGLLLQHHVRGSVATRSEFVDIGETPLLLLGSAAGINGTLGTQPWGNELSHNHVHGWGVWGRQAAGFFEGLSGGNNVSYNVFHDGPRAGANFNDGFGGGLTFEGNLLFNVVQDTGEHGSTNSWDRQPMLWRAGGAPDGALASRPAVRTVARNFVFRNSFRGATSNKWALDKDDGSSNYDEAGNVLLYGAVKDRDGQQRTVRSHLFRCILTHSLTHSLLLLDLYLFPLPPPLVCLRTTPGARQPLPVPGPHADHGHDQHARGDGVPGERLRLGLLLQQHGGDGAGRAVRVHEVRLLRQRAPREHAQQHVPAARRRRAVRGWLVRPQGRVGGVAGRGLRRRLDVRAHRERHGPDRARAALAPGPDPRRPLKIEK
jgi:hypothetical protein